MLVKEVARLTMPALFVTHVSPMLALEENAYTAFLQQLGQRLPMPKAVAAFSAHWDESQQYITDDSVNQSLHDFYGFPEELYQMNYTPTGAPEVSQEIQRLFESNNLKCQRIQKRGLDHGAWVILRAMYPEGNIPVVELSIDSRRSPQEQYEIGRMLASLREQGVLIIGSGGLVHHPRINREGVAEKTDEFVSWMTERLESWKLNDLFHYEKKAPHARSTVPSYGAGHLAPLFYAMGTADSDPFATQLYEDHSSTGISLDCWQFGGPDLRLTKA